MASFNITVR